MATLPTRELCADLATYLVEQVPTAGVAPNSVTREYYVRTSDKDDAALVQISGRRVTIAPTLPNSYSYEPETRGKDRYTHRISVLVEKRYTDAGDPTRAWLDTEVDWVYTNIVLMFDFDKRDGNGPTFNRQLVTLFADVQLFDLTDLLAHGKLFSSQVDIVFQELVDV